MTQTEVDLTGSNIKEKANRFWTSSNHKSFAVIAYLNAYKTVSLPYLGSTIRFERNPRFTHQKQLEYLNL